MAIEAAKVNRPGIAGGRGLPWNPALLEQSIARVHRLGQQRPVQVYLLVSKRTIEESLLATLGAKQELADAVLDPDSKVESVDMQSSVEALREKLEVLVGRAPEVSGEPAATSQHEQTLRRERAAAAAGELVLAAFRFLDGILAPSSPISGSGSGSTNDAIAGSSPDLSARRRGDAVLGSARELLTAAIDRDDQGRASLRLTLPDDSAIDAMAAVLTRLVSRASNDGGGR